MYKKPPCLYTLIVYKQRGFIKKIVSILLLILLVLIAPIYSNTSKGNNNQSTDTYVINKLK